MNRKAELEKRFSEIQDEMNIITAQKDILLDKIMHYKKDIAFMETRINELFNEAQRVAIEIFKK